MIQYILDVTITWTFCYLIFFIFLRKETFFNVNRYYLISSILIGLILPLLRHLHIDFSSTDVTEVAPLVMLIQESPAVISQSIETVQQNSYNHLYTVLIGLYMIGFAFFLIRMIKELFAIHQMYQCGDKEQKDDHTIIHSNSDHLPFSFLDMVFLSKSVQLREEYQEIIIHELAHIRARHSIDVLFMELINVVFWFNPLVYLYKSAIKQTHEYLADAVVLHQTDKKMYGHILLRQSLSGIQIALAHSFFHSHLKNRIKMMYQKKSGRWAGLKYLLALPVLFLVVVAFTSANSSSISNTNATREFYSDLYEIKFLGIEDNHLIIDYFTPKSDHVNIRIDNRGHSDQTYFEDQLDLNNGHKLIKVDIDKFKDSPFVVHLNPEGIQWWYDSEVFQIENGILESENSESLEVMYNSDYKGNNKTHNINKKVLYLENDKPTSLSEKERRNEQLAIHTDQTLWSKTKRYFLKLLDLDKRVRITCIREDHDIKYTAQNGKSGQLLLTFHSDKKQNVKVLMDDGDHPKEHLLELDNGRTQKAFHRDDTPLDAFKLQVFSEEDECFCTFGIIDYNYKKKQFETTDMTLEEWEKEVEASKELEKDEEKTLYLIEGKPVKPIGKGFFKSYNGSHIISDKAQIKRYLNSNPALEKYREENIEIIFDYFKSEYLLDKTTDNEMVRLSNHEPNELILDAEMDEPTDIEITIDQGHRTIKKMTKKMKGKSETFSFTTDDLPSEGFVISIRTNNRYSYGYKSSPIRVNDGKFVSDEIARKQWENKLLPPYFGNGTQSGTDGSPKEFDQYFKAEKQENLAYLGLENIADEKLDVSVDEKKLVENKDYTIDRQEGFIHLVNEEVAESGKPIRVQYQTSDTTIHKVVSEMPRFIGCESNSIVEKTKMKECSDEKLLEFLYSNLKYPSEARESKIEGRVYVQFIIEKNGVVSGSRIVKDIGGGCGKAVLDVLDKMNLEVPHWIPGRENGEKVRVLYTLPVTFKMEEESKNIKQNSIEISKVGVDNDKQPLFILDGKEVERNTTMTIDPDDIAKIFVLKDQKALDKYGSKGKNGVVEITTKKGKKSSIIKKKDKSNEFQKEDHTIDTLVIYNAETFEESMYIIDPNNVKIESNENSETLDDFQFLNQYGNGISISFSSKSEAPLTVMISSLEGRILGTRSFDKKPLGERVIVDFDEVQYSNGIYIVTIQQGDEILSKKVSVFR